jgi:hypothetical protein
MLIRIKAATSRTLIGAPVYGSFEAPGAPAVTAHRAYNAVSDVISGRS